MRNLTDSQILNLISTIERCRKPHRRFKVRGHGRHACRYMLFNDAFNAFDDLIIAYGYEHDDLVAIRDAMMKAGRSLLEIDVWFINLHQYCKRNNRRYFRFPRREILPYYDENIIGFLQAEWVDRVKNTQKCDVEHGYDIKKIAFEISERGRVPGRNFGRKYNVVSEF